MSEISTCAYLLAFKWFVTKFLLFYQCILYFQENRKEERIFEIFMDGPFKTSIIQFEVKKIVKPSSILNLELAKGLFLISL